MAAAGGHQQGASLPRHRSLGGYRGKALTPQSINLIVKRRCAMAGLEAREFSAHGLRAGCLTEAARRGVALPEAMQLSQHRSARYYNEAERSQGRAARLGV